MSSAPVLQKDFAQTAAALRACRICRDAPRFGAPLPHEPRPVVQGSGSARLLIASQAPGNRAHRSGVPFSDPSGVRLRAWLGLSEAAFYDATKVAILPMGACFPGLDAKGGDRPPRRECAPAWRADLLAGLPQLDLILVIGQYAQAWHLGRNPGGLTETVAGWRDVLAASMRPRILPLPHPSWRNNGWLRKNPWFEAELLPVLRAEVASALTDAPGKGIAARGPSPSSA
ncbi:uracil-DNA glycosylase [Methylobacterium sp. Leaf456]|uniref:uracil-DNA glycosylase family protein n=1 Tax=Methylobacterium sp. Leaf456 TaxID=1736382 RepID=UPI00070096C2|nr:uracil-DNA glycosylase family protein [Methylobacterium sp. Leaf456]KQT58579.1 uracil-DNA glycosylase [Methylobacterium sp. Leaf456]